MVRHRQELLLTIGMLFSGLAAGQSTTTCLPRVVVGRATTDAGDGGPATAAQLSSPLGFARDAAGNLYFADSGNNKIRVIGKDGIIRTVAGNGVAGSSGDGAAATSAQLNYPVAVIPTAQGEIYIADYGGNRVRKVLADGTIQTVAGNGLGGYGGDGGPAKEARINGAGGLALDQQGNLYISDSGNYRVRRVGKDGTIQTFGGSGPKRSGQTGDRQPAVTGYIDRPFDLAVGADGTLYIATTFQILRVTPDGTLHYVTQAGYGGGQPADGTPANQVSISPESMALDAQGNILFSAWSTLNNTDTVWRIGSDGNLHYVMDTPQGSGLLSSPDGTIIRSVTSTVANNQIVRYTPGAATPGTAVSGVAIAGQSSLGNSGDGGPGTQAKLNYPAGLATDAAGNLYIADNRAGRIRKLDTSGIITTIAGVDGPDLPSEGKPALQSVVASPGSIAVSSSGEVYYGEWARNRVRKIKADGTIATVAGNLVYPGPISGFPAAGAPATSVAIHPDSIAFDGSGNLYIADSGSGAIWRVSPSGIVNLVTIIRSTAIPLATTPGGTVYYLDYLGNLSRIGAGGKPETVKTLVAFPQGPFALDDSGALYLRGIDAVLYQYSSTGAVRALTTAATGALQVNPSAVTFDRSGNLFIADGQRARVLELPSAGTCVTPAFPFVSAIVNAASYAAAVNGSTPGEIVDIFGTAVGPGTLAQAEFDSNGSLPTSLAGTQVLVDGAPVPLLFASAGMTAAILPFGVATQDIIMLQVSVNGLMGNSTWMSVSGAAPGIFTNDASGSGQGAILNQDYSRNSTSNPARKGEAVAVYTTGLGSVSPAVADGALTPGTPSWQVQLPSATVDGQAATVLYAGTAPGLVAGVGQVNVVIPQAARSGSVPVVISFGTPPGNYVTQANVTVAVQ